MTEASGAPGQWYLHSFDATQPDWNWRDPAVVALFERVIRFWLDRGAAGFRVDVANGLFKDPALPDSRPGEPSPCWHRPELQQHYPSWRAIFDSYPADRFPGRRTAIGEVWYDAPGKVATLRPYLAGGGLPQVQLPAAARPLGGGRAARGDRGWPRGHWRQRPVAARQPRRGPAGHPARPMR